MRKDSASSQVKQSEKFKVIARAVECDESEVAFEDKLRRITKAKISAKKTHINKKNT